MIRGYIPKKIWNNEKFKRILSNDEPFEEAQKIKIPMTNLTLLILHANNNRAGWVPAQFFIHKETYKSYLDYRNEYKKLMAK